MAHPEEFTITIEPDGRIILDGQGMHETSYRRILELLEATVGPVTLEEAPAPPTVNRLAEGVHGKRSSEKDLHLKQT